MARKWTRTGAALLALFFSPGSFAADDADAAERPSDGEPAEAPDAIRRQLARVYPKARLVEAAVERSPAGDAWRLRLQEGLASREVVMDPGGGLVAESEEVALARVPSRVKHAIMRQFGTRSLWRAQRMASVGEEAWLVTFSRGDRVGEALVDGEGRLIRGTLG